MLCVCYSCVVVVCCCGLVFVCVSRVLVVACGLLMCGLLFFLFKRGSRSLFVAVGVLRFPCCLFIAVVHDSMLFM